MLRLPALFGLVTLAFALLVSAGATQDAKKEEKKAPPKIKGALPPGFKDLGLSKAQIEKIYAAQIEHRTKIAELQSKINELKKAENAEVFKLLTEEQREKYLKNKGVETKDKKKGADKKDGEKDKKEKAQ